jgi:hypothetical protein
VVLIQGLLWFKLNHKEIPMKLSEVETRELVGIGFCQASFYKPSVWRKAKKLMDEVVCPNKLAYSFDFGRGKGKYRSGDKLTIEDVKNKTVDILRLNNQLL